MNQPIFSVAGLRGIVGESFTPAVILPYLDAFARWIGPGAKGKRPRVVIGGDSRPSRRWAEMLATSVMNYHGVDVVLAGLAPTPTVGLAVREAEAAGGIAITASHNPGEWNGLKFFHSGGEFMTEEQHLEFRRLLASTPAADAPRHLGAFATLDDVEEYHLLALTAALPPGKLPPKARRPRIVIDCCNGAASKLAPAVAKAYGALAELIFADPRQPFPRGAEPLPENLGALCRAVKRARAAFGVAIDPDADRLAIVDERGRAIGEERTLLLAADAYYPRRKRKSPIAVNLSTTRAVDDLAARHGVAVHRTRIGEAHVLAGMRANRCAIGGEGNGGVILPAVHPGRDAATALALLLLGLRDRDCSMSEWNASFPDYAMVKDKLPLGKLAVADCLARIAKEFSDASIDRTDGVKAVFADRWLHVRPSGTEPIVRLFAEAPSTKAAQALVARARKLLA